MSISAEFAQSLAWARSQMPVTAQTCATLPDMTGVRLACSIHLDIKMIPALEAVLDKGGALYLTTCNPTTVRDDVVAYMAEHGAKTDAWRGMPDAEYRASAGRALAWRPTHTCEMGADITAAAHEAGTTGILAGLEATGSGIARLRSFEMNYPIFNWDDLPVKEGLHNLFQVGLSTWQAFYQRTRLSLHGKRVLVIGYGLVGQGTAESARAFGGMVSIAERDPARMLQAQYAGWHTGTVAELVPLADVIVTATGVTGVLNRALMETMKPGCFLVNVGHVAHEIEVGALSDRHEVVPFVEECRINGRTVYLFAGGSMANLTAGEGDSLNSFDLTLAIMVAGIGYIVMHGADWAKSVAPLPRVAWEPPARMFAGL